MKKLSLLFLSLFVLAACSKDDDSNNGTDGSSDTEITSFTFLATDHEGLSEDVKATIDKGNKTIKAELPSNVDIKTLKPTITVSEGASVSPMDKAEIDFSEAVMYTVTAEDGTEAKYTVTVAVDKSNEKSITSFIFLASENSSLTEDFTTDIDQNAKTITGELPNNAELDALKPTITVSDGATVDPNDIVTDFNETITYMVTAEDGSKAEYVVDLKRVLTEREALISIYEANPDNTLGWDIASEDISQWGGVSTENGLVTNLDLFQSNLKSMPSAIEYLIYLSSLDLGNNNFTELPEELSNLQLLRELFLDNNNLENFPIGAIDLKNLEVLWLSENDLTSLPPEIGNLSILESLQLNSNKIVSLPKEIGNLTKLEELSLESNEISTLPKEMGNLINLKALDLTDNQITTIPKIICELGIEDFRKDDTAICEE